MSSTGPAAKSWTFDPFASATEMLRALRAGAVSAVELLEAHLQRVERINPRLNAIVIPNPAARQAALNADRALASERSGGPTAGALAGLPLTIKDCIDVAGLRTTAGVRDLADHVAAADGPVAARIRAASGVLIGKTNVPPMAGDWQTVNAIFGRTLNPWDPERTPGGSTGGGAAALAAGLTSLELGSDIGGSIRVPAAFCGLYGHRPSETLVPRYGHVPGPTGPNPAFAMGVQGPLARDARDLQLALDVTAGPAGDEAVAWRLELPPARAERLADLRVAVLPAADWLPVDEEIGAALDELAARLSRVSARVQVASPERFDLREHETLYTTLLDVMIFGDLPPAVRERAISEHRGSDDPFAAAHLAGLEATANDLSRLFERREQYRAAFRAFFREWDVLLTPVTIVPAFSHDDSVFAARRLDVNGASVPYARLQVYPGLAGLSGQPATAFPVGRTRGGLPIGLQAIGPYLEDRTPIRFAELVAREWGGFTPPPGY